MKKLNLKTTPIPRLFLSYFLPSLVAMLALSTYSTIDGLFVGKRLGENALAAIGIAWPIFPVLIAFELLFSVGGAAMSSYFLGKGKALKARIIFSSVFYFAFFTSIIGGFTLYYFSNFVALYLGASTNLLLLVKEYTEIIYLGAFVIVLHPTLDIFAINDKQPILAMIAMIVGSCMNIVLNYLFLFIFDFGIGGSALATILGHSIGVCILLQHFLRKKGDLFLIKAFDVYALLGATKNGIPQSSSEISMSIMMLIFNHTIMAITGDRGIAIYSVVMYMSIIPFTILLSIAQGVQPISSFNYGANLLRRVQEVFYFSLKFSLLVGIILYIAFYSFGSFAIPWFLQDNITSRDALLPLEIKKAMDIYFISFTLLGINLVSATFFQSIQRTFISFIITLSYTLLFTLCFVLVLPKLYGFEGIMAAHPLGVLCASIVVFGIILKEQKSGILKKSL